MIAKLMKESQSSTGKRVFLLLDGPYGSLQTERLAELEDQLHRALAQAQAARVEVDLTYATSYGSGLITILLAASRKAKENGGRFCVVGDHAGVIKMLRLEGVL